MAGIDHAYRYGGRSSLLESAQDQHLSLVSETVGAAEPAGFLTACARAPETTARALRAISEIVATRFYVSPAMLARILREADPVATVGNHAVRFEGFSACCSTYVRLDLDDDALAVAHRSSGTTNVDFGPELRAALNRVRSDSHLEITIGPEAVGLSHETASVVERKVPLPMRWLKGFGEVQVHLSGMEPAFSLDTVPAQRFLRALPRAKSDHRVWVAAAGHTTRTTTRAVPGGVPLRGGHRLRVLEGLAARARALHVYRHPRLESSAWVLEFEAQRLVLALNAEPWRGFSGDGALLSDLACADAGLAALRAQLDWQDRLDLPGLARSTGQTEAAVQCAMARLAASGLVGFDLAEGAWFHRVLPFDMARVEALNPRLKSARALVASGAVRLTGDGAEITSGDVIHRVRSTDEGYSCTCPWFARNKTTRGPCKHVLAVEMEMERTR